MRDIRDLVVGITPFGRPEAGLTVAVERAGGLGVLDLGDDRDRALGALAEVTRRWKGSLGVRIPERCRVEPHELPDAVGTIVTDSPVLPEARQYLKRGRRLFVEVIDQAEARIAVRLGADGLIARGCEAGGRVGELTTFVLVQKLAADPELTAPIWAAGGIGLHTAAAAVAGGARGVVLDTQLALAAEVDLPRGIAAALRAMDGSETVVVDGHRRYSRPGTELPEFAVGQDGGFAAALAGTYKTAGGIVQAVRGAIGDHIAAAVRHEPLRREGERYPVLQGPMTRVSDRATFAAAVAQEGGLPFLALALMTGEEVRRLLTDTADRLRDHPWGVGILGFAPPEIREAQLAVVHEVKPPYALIAGGRPSQAKPLEEAGIRTYLHVPSPGLLERFLTEGARRFVFEGLECGGHVGPRASFPLWEAQLRILTAHAAAQGAEDLELAFAGGVHDDRSAAMVAALAGPLAALGAKIRVLMGTAYLFTHEAVAAGAILPGFQRAAVECDETVLLETSPGHATRCADTPYVSAFAAERERLERQGAGRKEMWERLEELNLGRLRIASKGLRRGGRQLETVGEAEQRLEGMYMIGQVATLRSATTSVVALHEQVSTGATRFLADRAAVLRPAATPEAEPLDIAIVGIGCVFPQAKDAREYWANIVGGVDAVTEVPAARWDPEIYWDPESASGERTPSKWGGFLPDIPFDALAYGIPPNSLGSVEPMQLLALEVASRALADAGYADRPFDRARTSVFFGAEAGTDLGTAYSFRAQLPMYLDEIPEGLDQQLPKLTEDSFPGVLTNMVAGRIANRLDLGGSSYTVNAACAASLAALDAACKELAAGASDMVLCGGADSHNGIYDYLLFASVHALSPTGRCATFDAKADGIALGEGVGCVVLKRLADAERDGDRIYAVVKAVAGSSDGRSLGLTAPRVEGQRLALERAYEQAGIAPAEVGMVEAHGTGTAVGDRTELTTLTSMFSGARPGSIALGSVKSQIGHTKCAAGLAGVIKAALAVHAGVRPGTLHLSKPAGVWQEETSPFAFDTAARPWTAPTAARVAGVSGFGFGGANFHAVLAGYDGAPEPVSGLDQWPCELFLIRGADRTAAVRELDRLAGLLSGGPVRLRDVARTCAESPGPVRLAIVADDVADLRAKLAAAREFRASAGVLPGSDTDPGKVAFLFPGQGSQRPGMLADLFIAFPRLQRLLHQAGPRYAEAMFPPAAFNPEAAERQRAAITDTAVAQPALGVAGLALHRLLTAVGVRPDMAAGHSYGELVALAAAGVYGDADLLELSSVRAAAILSAVGVGGDPGTMAAVAATAKDVRSALAGHRVAIANYNAPRQTVISGPTAAVDAAVALLAGRGISARRIPVACAFHSPLIAPAVDVLRAALDGRDLRPPAFPVWSNSSAAPYPVDVSELRSLLAGQVAAPVRFVAQIEAMYEAGARVFVEAGPGRVLSQLVGKILGDRPHRVVACDQPGENGLRRLLAALAELAACGVPVDARPLFAGRDAVVLAAAPRRLGWIVNGQLARTADGQYLGNALRPARRVVLDSKTLGGNDVERDAAVLEYLRTTRELVAAQRDVLLGYLGASALPAPYVPAATPGAVPAPRPSAPAPVVAGEVVAEASPGGPLTVDEIRAAVLGVISSRTGYPDDMLGADLDLEADLSIDSIKRTEIIGDLADRVGLAAAGTGLDEPTVEQLARIKSIGEIVTWIADHIGAAHPVAVTADAVTQPIPITAGSSPKGVAPTPDAPPPAGPRSPAPRSAASATGHTTAPDHAPGVPGTPGGESQPIPGPAVRSVAPAVPSASTGDALSAPRRSATAPVPGGPGKPPGDERAAAGHTAAAAAVTPSGGAPDAQAGAAAAPDCEVSAGEAGARGGEGAVGGPDSMSPGPGSADSGRTPGHSGAGTAAAGTGVGGAGRAAESGVAGGPAGAVAAAGIARVAAGIAAGQVSGTGAGDASRVRVGVPRRHLVRVETAGELPGVRVAPGVFAGKRFVIADDGCGIALELSDLLERHGARVSTPVEPEGPADGLIHLGALRPGGGSVLPGAYRGIREALLGGARAVLLATGAGGAFGHRYDGGGAGDPSPGAGLRGLARTLAQEFPEVLVRAVDVDPKESPKVVADRLFAELLTREGPVEVGYEGTVRRTLAVAEAPELAPVTLPLSADGVVLLTGGARGITARVAVALARETGCHIELAGRTPAPLVPEDPLTAAAESTAELRQVLIAQGGRTPRQIEQGVRRILGTREIRATLDQLEAHAASVRYHAVDVRDASAVRAVVQDVYARHGRLDGVIHGAGLLEDRLVRDKDPESFARVFRTKVDGAVALAGAVRPELGFFVVFGSVSGVYGNRGQADYAAANDACDTLARVWRTTLRGRVLVADWGPWAGGGMVSPELAQEYARRGVTLIEPAAGVSALLREIAAGTDVQVIFQ